jgi:hypothetical protein
MPSSYSAQNRFEEQNPGENLNTWGGKLNSNTTALIDFAISGYTGLSLSGPITLTSANGAADQARSAILDFTSGTGGTVTIPAVSHVYQVRNNTSGNVVFTTGSGLTATVEPGALATVICDGTNGYRLADAADIAACLAAAETYANGLAFESSSGNLPGQPGNAGNFLTTNGSTANWSPVTVSTLGALAKANNLSDVASAATALGNLGGAAASSVAAVSSSLGAVSSSVAGVSTSLAGVSSSLSSAVSAIGSAVSGTAANAMGYLGLPQQTKSANYGPVLADAGTELFFTSSGKTATIPANASTAFPIGTVLVFSIASGTLAVAITSDTMTWVPTGSGSRTVTGPGFLIARKIGATVWWVYGLGVT